VHAWRIRALHDELRERRDRVLHGDLRGPGHGSLHATNRGLQRGRRRLRHPCAQGATVSCTTSCGSTGTGICSAACTVPGVSACAIPAEACNGRDDDCDTVTDDGFSCASGANRPCTTSCGSTGSQTCGYGCAWGTCSPPAEVCNGSDDDCDGATDETFACSLGSSGPCTTTCGSTGSRTCNASCAWGTCAPPAETCNGLDDDCDTVVDNGFACIRGATVSCATTCGTTGSGTCTGTCAIPSGAACTPPMETCNGLDDDCDTATDETFACVRGSSGFCTTSCATTGSHTCSSSCAWGSCNPPTEICNGLDDDCDTVIDETFACIRDATDVACTTACGSTGTGTCSSTCSPPAAAACATPSEICSGVDDDCDGTTDEGFACVLGGTESCTTTCSTAGSRTCRPGCAWGDCAAVAEICGNSCDDDGDGYIDDGCTAISCTADSACSAWGLICNESWGICVVPSCGEQPDFMPCEAVTTPDRSYDICVGGTCVSPGCGSVTCNAPGPNWTLADTSQRTCFNNSASITCPGAVGMDCEITAFCGQDAQYGWDVTHAPTARFARAEPVGGQPTVTDNVTGLVWQGCPAGLSGSSCGAGTAGTYTWTNSLAYCDSLSWGGFADWRSPDPYELQSIADYGVASGASIDLAAFPTTPPSRFWSSSSSSVAGGASFAWYVNFSFYGGDVGYDDRAGAYNVRCVRRDSLPRAGILRFGRTEPAVDQSVVTDAATGLVLQGCVAGQTGPTCSGTASTTYSWLAALDYCQNLAWGGSTDWYLPSAVELRSIAAERPVMPAIDLAAFPATPPCGFWSSSSYAGDASVAWYVAFSGGGVQGYRKTRTMCVRCVRREP
jgi:hypothetical protein